MGRKDCFTKFELYVGFFLASPIVFVFVAQARLAAGSVDDVSHSFCKLLVAIGDHSTGYLASNIASSVQVQVQIPSLEHSTPPPTRAHLVQTFLKLLLSYASLPGYYRVDEEESELTLGFWYLFQEAIWSSDYHFDPEDEDGGFGTQVVGDDGDSASLYKAVYAELVRILRTKVKLPGAVELAGWTKGTSQAYKFLGKPGDA